MKLWAARKDEGLYVATWIVMAETAAEAVKIVTGGSFKEEDFIALPSNVIAFTESRWPDA
jgi:hypothetical protein